MVRVKINVWSYVYVVCLRHCSLLSTYGGSVRKASTLRVPRHYERAMSSEPWMDFNETNRGWSSSVDPDGQEFVVVPPLLLLAQEWRLWPDLPPPAL